jgi:hypothetical protein
MGARLMDNSDSFEDLTVSEPSAPFFGALSQLFIVGRNIEHQLLGFWIGHPTHLLGCAGA